MVKARLLDTYVYVLNMHLKNEASYSVTNLIRPSIQGTNMPQTVYMQTVFRATALAARPRLSACQRHIDQRSSYTNERFVASRARQSTYHAKQCRSAGRPLFFFNFLGWERGKVARLVPEMFTLMSSVPAATDLTVYHGFGQRVRQERDWRHFDLLAEIPLLSRTLLTGAVAHAPVDQRDAVLK